MSTEKLNEIQKRFNIKNLVVSIAIIATIATPAFASNNFNSGSESIITAQEYRVENPNDLEVDQFISSLASTVEEIGILYEKNNISTNLGTKEMYLNTINTNVKNGNYDKKTAAIELINIIANVKNNLETKNIETSLLETNGYVTELYSSIQNDQSKEMINQLLNNIEMCRIKYLSLNVQSSLLPYEANKTAIYARIAGGEITYDGAVQELSKVTEDLKTDLASKGVQMSLLDKDGYLYEYYSNKDKINKDQFLTNILLNIEACRLKYEQLSIASTLIPFSSNYVSITKQISDGKISIDDAIVLSIDLLEESRLDLANKGISMSLLDKAGYQTEYSNLNKCDQNMMINRLISNLDECKQAYSKLGISVSLLNIDNQIKSIEMLISAKKLTEEDAIVNLTQLLQSVKNDLNSKGVLVTILDDSAYLEEVGLEKSK